MRSIPAFIFVLLMAVLPSCKFFQNKVFGKKARALAEMKARQDSIRIADSVKKSQDYFTALENARLDSLRKAEEERKLNETKYNIIVGSFMTPEYARIMSEQYRTMGYNPQIIKIAGSKFELVAAEGHKSLRSAVARLTAFRDTVQMESWIYVRQ
ncbi:MAG TPA: hypothetical protein VHO68_15035 [Bacteroidales bacterium]|nr:hypothetical protein [Bacteroidales bacterium]